MYARAGDRIVIAPRSVGGAVRDGEILETRGPNGAPPYLVRWSEDGHEAGQVVRVASWQDANRTSLVAHPPEPTEVVVELGLGSDGAGQKH